MKPFFTALLTLLYVTSFATNFYVSNAGSDLNPGTSPSSPFKTIAKVNSLALRPGDRVLFSRGDVWHEAIRINYSGSAGKPIIYSSYGSGANPVITGFVSVSAWKNISANIWESTSAVSTLNDLNMVVINGVNTAMGRTPNTGYFPYQSFFGSSAITSTSVNSRIINWTGADLVLRHNNFIISRDLITAHSGNTITYSSTVPLEKLLNGYGYFIENDPRTLDRQNEWYFNPSTKKIRIFSASMPSNVQVSTLDTLVYMVTKSNLTFDGIDFTGSNRRAFFIGSSSDITIQNCKFDYHGLYVVWGGTNFGRPSNNFNFNHNTVNHVNSQAIDLQNEFVNPYIGFNSFKNTGVLPGMFKVPGLPISRWDQAYGSIRTQNTDRLHVEYNTFDSSGYTQIHFTGSNCRINNNFCQHWETELMDGGSIYTWTGPTTTPETGSVIEDNILVNAFGTLAGTTVTGAPLVHGIYTDDNTTSITVRRNSVANVAYSGIYIHQTHESVIRDNTVYNAGRMQVLFEYREYPIRNNTVRNNIFFAKTSTQNIAKFQTISSALPKGDITSFFTSLDSNYYTRPTDEVSTRANFSPIEVDVNNHPSGFYHYNLAQWKAFMGKDASSTKAPKSVASADSFIFIYNATRVPVTTSLPFNYIDVRNVSYNGKITLQPFTSAVLIQHGPAVGRTHVVPIARKDADNINIAVRTGNTDKAGAVGAAANAGNTDSTDKVGNSDNSDTAAKAADLPAGPSTGHSTIFSFIYFVLFFLLWCGLLWIITLKVPINKKVFIALIAIGLLVDIFWLVSRLGYL